MPQHLIFSSVVRSLHAVVWVEPQYSRRVLKKVAADTDTTETG
jgi:hypothetical protein